MDELFLLVTALESCKGRNICNPVQGLQSQHSDVGHRGELLLAGVHLCGGQWDGGETDASNDPVP